MKAIQALSAQAVKKKKQQPATTAVIALAPEHTQKPANTSSNTKAAREKRTRANNRRSTAVVSTAENDVGDLSGSFCDKAIHSVCTVVGVAVVALCRLAKTLTAGTAIGCYMALLFSSCVIAPPLFVKMAWYTLFLVVPSPFFWYLFVYWASATVVCYVLDYAFTEYAVKTPLPMKTVGGFLWKKITSIRIPRWLSGTGDNDTIQ